MVFDSPHNVTLRVAKRHRNVVAKILGIYMLLQIAQLKICFT